MQRRSRAQRPPSSAVAQRSDTLRGTASPPTCPGHTTAAPHEPRSVRSASRSVEHSAATIAHRQEQFPEKTNSYCY
eukprot:scaffold187856_cov31-Tisochrysis_lutea.AAC.1